MKKILIYLALITLFSCKSSYGQEFQPVWFDYYAGPLENLKPSIKIDKQTNNSSGNRDVIEFSTDFEGPPTMQKTSCGLSETRSNASLNIKISRFLKDDAFTDGDPLITAYSDFSNGIVEDKHFKNTQNANQIYSRTSIEQPQLYSTIYQEYEKEVTDLNQKYNINRTIANQKAVEAFQHNYTQYVSSRIKDNYQTSEIIRKSEGDLHEQEFDVLAGNVIIHIDYSANNLPAMEIKDVKRIADEILNKLPRKILKYQGTVEVYPSITNKPTARGLIPATNSLFAQIMFKDAEPDTDVTFSMPTDAPGYLKYGELSGKTLNIKIDKNGQAPVNYFFDGTTVVTKPLLIPIEINYKDTRKNAHVIVGLGLDYAYLKGIKVPVEGDKTFGLKMAFLSGYFPDLDVNQYLSRAEILWSPVETNIRIKRKKTLGVKTYAYWLNKPEDAEHDNYYNGYAEITDYIKEARALNSPSFELEDIVKKSVEVDGFSYTQTGKGKGKLPAIILNSAGQHVYQIISKPAMLNIVSNDLATSDRIEPETTLEPPMKAYPLVLSYEQPEALFQSLACAMEARTGNQFLVLESLKKIPAYGKPVDAFLTTTSFVCGITKGDYASSIAALSFSLGGNYLDDLLTPANFAKLGPYQQAATVFAKVNHKGADLFMKASDFSKLPLNEQMRVLRESAPAEAAMYFPNGVPMNNSANNYRESSHENFSFLLTSPQQDYQDTEQGNSTFKPIHSVGWRYNGANNSSGFYPQNTSPVNNYVPQNYQNIPNMPYIPNMPSSVNEIQNSVEQIFNLFK